jgi:hypothetical protein
MEQSIQSKTFSVNSKSRIGAIAGIATGIGLSFLGAGKSEAMVINMTPDATVTGLGNFAQIQTAYNFAALQFTNAFSDNITINITVSSVPGTTTLGLSNTSLQGYYGYTNVTSALNAKKTTAADTTYCAALPANSPAGSFWVVPNAEAKVLGLLNATNTANDGTFTFGRGFTYALDPTNRAVAGAIDYVGLAEHEISEIMGRIYGQGRTNTAGTNIVNTYTPMDLGRFTSSNVRSLNLTDTGVYYSVDNGITNLKKYNDAVTYGGDFQDWVSGTNAGATNDSFNAFSSSNVVNDLSPVDLTVIDTLGYTPVPEPTSAMAIVVAGGYLLARRRRKVIDNSNIIR